jgi:RNA polymerase sigma-B factor
MTETSEASEAMTVTVTGHADLTRAIAAHRRARSVARRTRERLEGAVDRCAARRTVPRGAGPRDADRTPGVDVDTWLLHVRLSRTGDPSVLAQLAQEYDRYACSLAARLHRDQEAIEDLEQVAREGLLSALRRFDPERSLPFPAFATPTILGALRRHYRDRGWSVRVPRRVHELAVASRQVEERLTSVLGRVPGAVELATEMGISVDELLEVRDAVHARNAASLEGLAAEGGDWSARGSTRDPLLAHVDDHLDLRAALAHLDDRDRDLVRRYFFEECSQSEIAAVYGVSQMQVSRWLASILRRLRVWVQE